MQHRWLLEQREEYGIECVRLAGAVGTDDDVEARTQTDHCLVPEAAQV